ncbi:MAG: hypothetical protein P8016_12100 [Sedimentisphaerales bacterium]
MRTIKGFWLHKNGKIYAIESDTFGNIIGGIGPLDTDDLRGLESYDYRSAINDWLKDAVAQKQLRRVNLTIVND